jgi:hypothetical protein
MTMPEQTLREIRDMLDQARPDRLRKLLKEIQSSGDERRGAA